MSSGNTSSQRVAKALELNAKEDKQPEPLLIFIVVNLLKGVPLGGYILVSIHLTVGFIAGSLVRFEKHFGSGLMVIEENIMVRFRSLLIVYNS